MRQRRDSEASEETAKQAKRQRSKRRDSEASEETAKRLAANMSAPRSMMEREFEPEGYAYQDYDAAENEEFYADYDDGVCTICMGGSFVRKIYIACDYYEEEDYDF